MIDSYTTKSPGKEVSLPSSRNPITDSANPRASSTVIPTTAEPIKDEHATAKAEPSALARIAPIRPSSETIATEQKFPVFGLVHSDCPVG